MLKISQRLTLMPIPYCHVATGNVLIYVLIIIMYYAKPRFLMSGTLILSHNSQNTTYFVTKFGMHKFCVVP